MRYLLIFTSLIISLLLAGCTQPGPIPTQTTTQIPLTPTIASTEAVIITPKPTKTPIPPPNTPTTIPRPTKTRTPTKTPTLAPKKKDLEAQLAIFEEFWGVVYEHYLDPKFNGIDWAGLHDQYQTKIEKGVNREQFWALLNEAVTQLGDHHTIYLNPDDAKSEDLMTSGEDGYAGLGINIYPLKEEEAGVITWVAEGNAADKAGLRAGDRLISVDDQPLCCDEEGDLFDIIRGPTGSSAVFVVHSPNGKKRKVTIERQPIKIGQTVRAERLENNIGYIVPETFWFEQAGEQFREAWSELNADLTLTGLIIDMRGNSGGLHSERDEVLRLFAQGEMGFFRTREVTSTFNLEGENLLRSQTIPLVVLVGYGTNSNGELFASALQGQGRAKLVGNPTQANVESLYPYNFADRSRLWLAEEVFIPRNGHDINREGLLIDVPIEQNWLDVIDSARDDALNKAIELLTTVEN